MSTLLFFTSLWGNIEDRNTSKAFGIEFRLTLWWNNEEKHRKEKKTLVRIPEQGIFGIASKAQTSKLAAWPAAGMGAIARRAVRSGSLQIAIFMFSARAGNISLAPIHFPPYLSALIPETSDQVPVPQIWSALPPPPPIQMWFTLTIGEKVCRPHCVEDNRDCKVSRQSRLPLTLAEGGHHHRNGSD